jgi:ribose/xylose/arabinose/galactoside ABC-type transport system permease subunit
MGAITLIVIENGLNLIGASPFIYPFVRGIIIFTAMYADSLKSQVHARGRAVTPEG